MYFSIGLPSNSQDRERWSESYYCRDLNPSVKAECTFNFGSDTNYSGFRELMIEKIEGNGGNVFVRISDDESGQIIHEADPGAGGRERFYFNGQERKRGFKIFMRLHNPGSSALFKVRRAR